MKEIIGNIWEYYNKSNIAICITTNGCVKENNDIVAGRGCAKEACSKIPNFARLVGLQVSAWGNIVYRIKENVYSFPVKHHWMSPANLKLIEQSCKQLVKEIDKTKFQKVIVPRPGCGNGQLLWKNVKPVCAKYFDNRFYIISKGEK